MSFSVFENENQNIERNWSAKSLNQNSWFIAGFDHQNLPEPSGATARRAPNSSACSGCSGVDPIKEI